MDLASEAKVTEVFQALDRDGNGFLSAEELMRALEALGVAATADSAEHLLKRIHAVDRGSNDGDDSTVTLGEFAGFYRDRVHTLRASFDTLLAHAQEHGGITADGLRRALKELDLTVSREDVNAFMERVDANRDGSITLQEWVAFALLLPGHNVRALFDDYWRLTAPSVESVNPEWSAAQHFHDRPPAPQQRPAPHVPDADQRPSAQVAGQLVAGGVAGAVSRTATAPIDRIRLLMQAGSGPASRHATMASVLRDALQRDGVRGLWRGNLVNTIKIMPETATRFTAFDMLKSLLAKDPSNVSPAERFAAGGLAGALSQALIYPLEIVRTRLALAERGTYRSILHCMTTVARQEGLASLYSGLSVSTLGIIPFAGIDLAVNSLLREYATSRLASANRVRSDSSGASMGILLGCGMVSSTTAMLATFPIGLVRTKLQASGMPGAERYAGVWDVMQRTWQSQGLAGFYRGVLPTLLKVVPSTSLSYATYGYLKSALAGEE